ncbi:hypothetical protein ACFQZC_11400 [Streptacidiphilus monticola]
MYASPALLKLLADPRNTLLRERIPYRVAGAIGHAGLLGPGELYYYAGDGKLTAGQGGVYRTNSIGGHVGPTDLSILLTMLLTVGVVVVLLPIGILIGTAARVGGERRDRRLAALRLVGVDRPGVHRITAGESMVGAAGACCWASPSSWRAVRSLPASRCCAPTSTAPTWCPTPVWRR